MMQPDPDDPWKIRRTVILTTLLYIAGMDAFLVLHGIDTGSAREFVTSSLYLAGLVIGSYVFGATWDDRRPKDGCDK